MKSFCCSQPLKYKFKLILAKIKSINQYLTQQGYPKEIVNNFIYSILGSNNHQQQDNQTYFKNQLRLILKNHQELSIKLDAILERVSFEQANIKKQETYFEWKTVSTQIFPSVSVKLNKQLMLEFETPQFTPRHKDNKNLQSIEKCLRKAEILSQLVQQKLKKAQSQRKRPTNFLFNI